MRKKILSLTLAVIMLLALAVPAMATDASTGPDTATLDGVGFHCNHGGTGNGKTSVYYSETGPKDSSEILDAKGKVLKGVAADTGTKFKFDFERVDETTWKLVSENYYCAYCGNNVWASYSNKSGVPNGKNIQVNPYTAPEPEPEPDPDLDIYGSLSIQKTVGGVDFDEWAIAKGLTSEQIADILGGMKFTAYLLDSESGSRVVPEKAYPGTINVLAMGIIDFGNLPIGWYEVVEEVSGTAVNYFVGEGGTKVVYVGETDVSGEIENFVSGREGIGTIVSHNGEGVNWQLPKVWNDRFANDSTFQKLMDMGAQWIWDVEDTYIYGVSGSAIELKFEVTLGEAINVPLYFAADNVALIYVNGKLAAFTDVALAGRNINIGDDYIGIDALGEKKSENFDGRWDEGWAHAYEKQVSLNAGENEIIIIAANSASTGYIDELGNFVRGTSGSDNDSYDLLNNPCGLIFGFAIPAVTFDNEPKLDTDVYGEAVVNVEFEIKQDTVTYGDPEYRRLTDKNETATLVSYRNHEETTGSSTNQFSYLLDGESGRVAIAVSSNNHNDEDGIGQYYNYEIVGDQLVVTFDEDLYKADVSIMVNTVPEFPNGHPKAKDGAVQGILGEVTKEDDEDDGEYSLTIDLPEGDEIYLYLHIAGGFEWYTGEVEIIENSWKVIGSVTNDVEAVVEELIVEIWLGDEFIAAQDITSELNFNASFDNLEDGEYTIIVRGIVNGEEFNESQNVVIEDKSSESIDIVIQIQLDDIEIYEED